MDEVLTELALPDTVQVRSCNIDVELNLELTHESQVGHVAPTT